MQFDQNNSINKLCAAGMQLEGEGKPDEAAKLFTQAWNEATDTIEKLTAAHYIARHQDTVMDKLKWDQVALSLALEIGTTDIKSLYPSLYLNVAKGYEDMEDPINAGMYYELANSYSSFLSDDGYGKMIKAGIAKGMDRVQPSGFHG